MHLLHEDDHSVTGSTSPIPPSRTGNATRSHSAAEQAAHPYGTPFVTKKSGQTLTSMDVICYIDAMLNVTFLDWSCGLCHNYCKTVSIVNVTLQTTECHVVKRCTVAYPGGDQRVLTPPQSLISMTRCMTSLMNQPVFLYTCIPTQKVGRGHAWKNSLGTPARFLGH